MQNERVASLKVKLKQCSLPSIDALGHIDNDIITLLESITVIKTNLDSELSSLRYGHDILEHKNKSLQDQIGTQSIKWKESKLSYQKSLSDVLRLNKGLLNKEKEYQSTIKSHHSVISDIKGKLAYLASLNQSSTVTMDTMLTVPQKKKTREENPQTGLEKFNQMVHSALEREVSELKTENSEMKTLLIDFIEQSIKVLYDNNKDSISPYFSMDRLRNLVELKSGLSKECLTKATNEIIEMQKESLQWKEELMYLSNSKDNESIGYILMLFEYYKEMNSNVLSVMKNIKLQSRRNKDENNEMKTESKDMMRRRMINNNNTNENSKVVNYLCEKMSYTIKDVQSLMKFFEGNDN